MDILLTNDDGIFSPGLWAMEECLRDLGRVSVVAPTREQSGVGHAITYLSPVSAERVTLDGGQVGYALTGTPADCVKLGLLELLQDPPDLVVSGINLGPNLGLNVFYSGTVAAALEGAMNGILSVAVSTSRLNAEQLSRAANQAMRVLRMILDSAPEGALAYNVNVPALRDGEPEVLFTSHKAAPFVERYVPQHSEAGQAYQLDMLTDEQASQPDMCDVHAVAAGMISVTPLRPNLTDMDSLRRLETLRLGQHSERA